jgi:ribosomal protein S12 methylthiotransferase
MISASLHPSEPITVGMISLGCAKNLVDAEVMLGSVAARGMQITVNSEQADVLVINTCAFIDAAKEESIEAILQAHQQRTLHRPEQKLVVAGCMSQRYAQELRQSLPEVDAFIGLDQVTQLGGIVEGLLQKRRMPNVEHRISNTSDSALGVRRSTSDVSSSDPEDLSFQRTRPTYVPDYDTPRFRLTPAHSVYLKIAEGCNHPCTFCVIPQMRGKHRSRSPHSVLSEIRALVGEGVREINLISQDTTYYGMDLWPEKASSRQPVDSSRGPGLSSLLQDIERIDGQFWIRLLYTHPAHWSDELIETIAQSSKVARYIDIPLQHITEPMLNKMRRETSRAHIEELIGKLRHGIPGVALRTTFIVGFPGETEADFESLLEFIERTRFERLGIFKYSKEDGSRAAKMADQVSQKTKNTRYRQAMLLQQRIAFELAQQRIGTQMRLLVDQPFIARSEFDAPDIDTRVILKQAAPVGEFATRTITGTRGYDLLTL